MQIPSILQGESRTRLIQGMVIGAVASMVIGFSWGGWLLGSTAHRLAADQASTAVVAVLTPICVEKFLQNSDAQANLAALRKISTNWQQGQYVEKGGWVTGGSANKLAAEQAGKAVVAVLTPLCVAKFQQDGDAKANLAVLQKISSNWEQGQYLEKGGWATRPGAASPDYELARACAAKLIAASQ